MGGGVNEKVLYCGNNLVVHRQAAEEQQNYMRDRERERAQSNVHRTSHPLIRITFCRVEKKTSSFDQVFPNP